MIEYKGNEIIDHGPTGKDFKRKKVFRSAELSNYIRRANFSSDYVNDGYLAAVKQRKKRRFTNPKMTTETIGQTRTNRRHKLTE